MLYFLFMVLAIVFNWIKFIKERSAFLSSLIEAENPGHREMILSHHFYIFVFEGFLAMIVAHLITDQAAEIGILGLGTIYITLIFVGFWFYKLFIRYVEKQTELSLYQAFKAHLIRDLRVNFAIILLPILVYSLINYAFQDSVYEEWGNWWLLGMLLNIIFVSVLTIACSVILMLRLIPNREITEPEYLAIIDKRLEQVKMNKMRVRWIETDIKNAFVVGLKLLRFSNQTMFIGRSLRKTLTMEEFDAVIAHEVAHIANRHIHKRVIELMKNFVVVFFGIMFLMFFVLGVCHLYWGEDTFVHSSAISSWLVLVTVFWIFFNYSLFFDTIRSHEFEADAYAVMELGASYEALNSALVKLTNTEELPEYLKRQVQKKNQENRLVSWIRQNFSTHPTLETRMNFLAHKMMAGLPFNYYVSTPQKIRHWLGGFFHWKVTVPTITAMLVTFVWGFLSVKKGYEQIDFISRSSAEQIKTRNDLVKDINSKPLIVQQSLMYFIVKKKDPQLIDFFLERGADKGKTLAYISSLKDYKLFEAYYGRFESSLTEEEYYLLLMRTAHHNFTDGYRLLVNAKRFEGLSPSYKEDISRELDYNRPHDYNRRPASAQPQE